MKPLHLTVRGLHSYVEPVSVDLEALGRYGLFGIFGPIGSGKSSLLDALTLALYGLVDRMAGRSRRGIVNLDSTEVEVRLQFAVSAAGGPSAGPTAGAGRYEVHRLYRATATGVQRVTSRLARLDEQRRPTTVLADKEREVNEAVADLIGLCAEDFMRAVVLPQGRFMEVLHLRGSERRKMLQRIFGLHAYGAVLRQRLRARQATSRERLASVEGELAGLGDASPASVRAARRAEEQAHQATQQAATQAELATRRHADAEHARARHAAWRTARDELAAHRLADAEMEALQAKHDEAVAMRPRVHPARRWLDARHELASAQQSASRRQERAEQVAARRMETAATLEDAVQAEATEVPALRQRLAALEEARRWSIERQALGERVAKLRHQVDSQRQRREEGSKKLATVQAHLKEVDKRRRSTKRKLDQARVDPQEREWLIAATEIHQSVRHARDRLAAEKRRLADVLARREGLELSVEARRQAASEARRQLVKAAEGLAVASARAHDARPDKQEARLATLREAERVLAVAEQYERQLASLRDQLAVAAATESTSRAALEAARDQAAQAQQRVRGADDALEAARRSVIDAQARHAASQLAAHLTDGAPCPVCGSASHPHPAPHEDAPTHEAVRAHERGRQVALERLGEARGVLGAAEEAVARASRQQQQVQQACDAARSSLEQLWRQLPELDAVTEPAVQARQLVRTLSQQEEQARAAMVQLDEARGHHEAAAIAAERAAAPLAAAEAQLTEADGQRQEATTAVERAEAEEGRAWKEWNRVAEGRITFFDVPATAAAQAGRDREAHRLQGELERLDAQRADLQRQREHHHKANAQHDKELATVDERLVTTRQQVADLEARLAERTQGADPTTAVEDARQHIHALHERVVTARTTHAAATEEAATAAAEHAAAQAGLDAARKAADEAHHSLVRVGGDDLPDTLDALLALATRWAAADDDEALVASWASTLVAHAETTARLRAREELLASEASADPPLDDDAFEALAQARAQCERAAATARDELASRRQQRVDVEERAARYAVLTDERATVQGELGRLDHLSTVLRGDRFVEFVANDLLSELAHGATEHLRTLTDGRYSLALDDDGAFLIRDHDAGGAVRPVHTLSGGEAFLTSLALALSLSTQVQARGVRPLEFFFLDEGFGTLDPEALDRVMSAIESLRDGHRIIGLISHVPAVRERVPSQVRVWPAGTKAKGSYVETVMGAGV